MATVNICPKCGEPEDGDTPIHRDSQGRNLTTLRCVGGHFFDVRELDAEFAERIEAAHAAD